MRHRKRVSIRFSSPTIGPDAAYYIEYELPNRKDGHIWWNGLETDYSDPYRGTRLVCYGVLDRYGKHSEIVKEAYEGNWQALKGVVNEHLKITREKAVENPGPRKSLAFEGKSE